MKKISFVLFILALFGLIVGCEMGGGNNNGGDKPVKPEGGYIYRVDVVEPAVQYQKTELALYEKELKIAEGGNPYDYNYLRVMAEITAPSGAKLSIPAFWYQDYQITLNTNANLSPSGVSGVASTDPNEPQGLEVVTPIGDPHYRVRFTPTESGSYNVVFKVYAENVLVATEHEMVINVASSGETYKGVLEVDPTTHRNFRFVATGETFVTVGQNACWYTSSTRKTTDYDVWFSKMHENEMNTSRIWLGPWAFGLHCGTSYNDFSSRYAAAARLDLLLEYAEQYDIYIMMCLINHGQFSTTVNPTWDSNPYNIANGGILEKPQQFFSSEEAKKAYKSELMYIIARYSYCSHILCWELFNEVDWCDGASLYAMWFKTWHNEMGQYLKDNDPYHHMVSTSYRGTDGNANSLDVIDFVSPHDYSYSNKNMINNVTSTQKTLFDKYTKPVFFGEIGLNGENGQNNYNQDSQGISLHQAQWGGMMSGGAGGAMNWWWDSYVHPHDLYSQFKGAGVFAKKMNLSGSDYSLLNGNASTSNSNVNIIGYGFNTRAYGYLYDKSWTYYNTNMTEKSGFVSLPITDGTYEIRFYDTNTGALIEGATITAQTSVGVLSFNFPSFRYDVAFIVEAK